MGFLAAAICKSSCFPLFQEELDPECTCVCRQYLIDVAAFAKVYVVEEHTNLREEL